VPKPWARRAHGSLQISAFARIVVEMSAEQVIEEFKALPPREREQVAEFVLKADDSWIPLEFKQGMADIAAGRTMDLDEALKELDKPDRAPLPNHAWIPQRLAETPSRPKTGG
jgi:hypothetical protein